MSSRLLVLANLELAFEIPEGVDADELVRAKERRLMRLLRQLAGDEGSLERLELESFAYDSGYDAEPSGYYYNKYNKHENNPDLTA
jgi:hypothetical protein